MHTILGLGKSSLFITIVVYIKIQKFMECPPLDS